MNRFHIGEDQKIYCIKCNKVRKFKNPKILYILDQFFLLFVTSVAVMIKKIFKEEESIEILKILCLIKNIEEYQVNM